MAGIVTLVAPDTAPAAPSPLVPYSPQPAAGSDRACAACAGSSTKTRCFKLRRVQRVREAHRACAAGSSTKTRRAKKLH